MSDVLLVICCRNAKKKEIMKAYRKLAAEWHPDKHQGDDKDKAEKMFRDIAAAKEVLSDPGKDPVTVVPRSRFQIL